MNKVVSIFRALLVPTSPPPDYESAWQSILVPDLDGYKIKSSIGRITLQRTEEFDIAHVGSVYSPRTPLCGPNEDHIPVTAGKPYRVLAAYVGSGRRKKQIHFFLFQCDDGSIHLVKTSDCEFLGSAPI